MHDVIMSNDHRADHDHGRTLPDPALGLGVVIRLLREAAGMSQKELAYRVGTTASYISQIESGSRKWPRKFIGPLARTLDVTPSYLGRAARKIVDDAEFVDWSPVAPEPPVPDEDAAWGWASSADPDDSPRTYRSDKWWPRSVDALRRDITALLPAVPDHQVAALHTIVVALAAPAGQPETPGLPVRVRPWSSLMRRLNRLDLDEHTYHALLDWVTSLERLQATRRSPRSVATPVPSTPPAAPESTPADHPASDPASGPRNNPDESA